METKRHTILELYSDGQNIVLSAYSSKKKLSAYTDDKSIARKPGSFKHLGKLYLKMHQNSNIPIKINLQNIPTCINEIKSTI